MFCFSLSHVHSFSVPLSWNMSLCRVSFFLNWRSFKLKHLKTVWIHWMVLSQAITVLITVHCRALLHDHCRALWQLWLPQLLEGLSSTQLSLTVVWLTSHWEGSTNWWLTHWECPHWATKVFQPLRCWHQHCQSLRLLRSTTYWLKLSLLWGLTVRHWRALHWAKNGFLQLPYLAVWLMDCMEFATQFLVQTVPATAFHWQHCILADVRTGMHWRMRRHCFPTARCRTPLTHWRSSTAMASVDLRLWRSWLDWLSKVMWSPLARLHKACALRPHWALPRRSWTLDWFLWNCSLTPKWTTGFAQGLHCWGHCRSTGQVTLTHWMFRNRWHWSSTTLDWRGILPRPLFMDWRATGLTLKEKLKRTLTSTDCTWTTAGLLDHFNWVFSWTLRSPALDLASYCPSLSRNWWSHCRWNWTATRSLACTAEDWLDTASSLWISWNWCMKMWALNVPGCTCSLMRNCQRKLEADWQLLMEKLALPRSMWRSLDCLLDLRRWLWLSLVTETEYTHVIFEATVFEHCYVDWCTEVLEAGSLMGFFSAHLHTAPRLIDTVQLITDCVFHWLASMIDHCMHVQVCDTDSLNQCQGEVLRYMHCTHTTAHSNDTVKHTHCLAQAGLKYLAQVTDKKADWVYTDLTWIAHC